MIYKRNIINKNNFNKESNNSIDNVLKELHLIYSGKYELIKPIYDQRFHAKEEGTSTREIESVSFSNENNTNDKSNSSVPSLKSQKQKSRIYDQVESICSKVYSNKTPNININKNVKLQLPERDDLINSYSPKYIKSLQKSVLCDKRINNKEFLSDYSKHKRGNNILSRIMESRNKANIILPSLSKASINTQNKRTIETNSDNKEETKEKNEITNTTNNEFQYKENKEKKDLIRNNRSYDIKCYGINLNRNNQQYYLLFKKDNYKKKLPPIKKECREVLLTLPQQQKKKNYNEMNELVNNYKKMEILNKYRFVV